MKLKKINLITSLLLCTGFAITSLLFMSSKSTVEATQEQTDNYGTVQSYSAPSPAPYTLQDSTMVGYYNGDLNYNCYAYAIGRKEQSYEPGDFSDTAFDLSMPIGQMVNVVQLDLEFLGFDNVHITNTLPEIQSWQKLICMRKGADNSDNVDYHFMKYDQAADAWYHKPGKKAILKWNYSSPDFKVWTSEFVDETGEEIQGDIIYDSDIYYIVYNPLILTNLTPTTVAITGVGQGANLSGRVELPYIINGKTVTAIGPNAFANQILCTELVIPSSVTSIGYGAFDYCTGLTEINIPSGITAIGDNVFSYCVNLTSITIPNSVTNIGFNAFSNCTGLTDITIPSSVTSVGSSAFLNCPNLSITWEYNYALTAANFKENLKQVEIPADITLINPQAFLDCTSLTAFIVDSLNAKYISHDGVIYTKDQSAQDEIGPLLAAYPSGKEDTSFTVHANATEISAYAFNNCNILEEINLNNVKVVRNNNFDDCANLATVMGNSIEYIESDTFDGTTPFIQNFAGDYVYLGKALLLYKGSEADIKVTDYWTIRDGAFSDNEYLVTVTFGSSVVNIGSGTFLNCPNLEKVIFEASSRMVSCGTEPFDLNLNPNLKIIVPHCVFEDYETNDFWSNYVNNFETPQTFVIFNLDGGSADFYDTIFTYGEPIDFNNFKPEKTDYTFAGWYDNDNNYIYRFTSQILWKSLDGTITLCALWVDSSAFETYDIVFISYDGWIVYGYYDVLEGDPVDNASPYIPEREWFNFAGWYTGPNGTGDAFSPFTAVSDMTFYALWTCTITFDSNGGNPVNPMTVSYLETILMPIRLPESERGGYIGYWESDAGDYNFYAPFTVTGNITFNAAWTEKTLGQCYNGNTGIYEIYTRNQLAELSGFSSLGQTFKIMNDIDCTGWIPIPEFSGTLDGNEKKITMSISGNDTANLGLIGTNNGIIKYLVVIGSISSNSNINSYQNVGLFAGTNNGTIYNCAADSYIGNNNYSLTVSNGNYYYYVDIFVIRNRARVGGIAGYNNGIIRTCNNNGVSVHGRGEVGGIAGCNEGNGVTIGYIYNVINLGRVFYLWQTTNGYAGGIVGNLVSGKIETCYNYGIISYDNTYNPGNLSIQPRIGQVAGFRSLTASTVINYTYTGFVNTGTLSGDQLLYAGNRAFGKQV